MSRSRYAPILLAVCVCVLMGQPAPRLRVSVNLVQVDATVADGKGGVVSDLKREDFRVLLDGKAVPLRFCDFVAQSAPGKAAAQPMMPERDAAKAARPKGPEETIRREDVRRTVVLFVADLTTSAESIPAIRAGLRRFVTEQMQPGDLVAIVRASAGFGALQDFTPDKTLLLASIERVRWSPHAVGTAAGSAYEMIGEPSLGGILPSGIAALDRIDSIERATLATTSALQQLTRSVAPLPGHKSIIVLSDGLRLASPDEMGPDGQKQIGTGAFIGPIYESMRRLVDESLRAGVTVYSIDTRGLASLTPTASDRLKPPGADNPGIPLTGMDGEWIWKMAQGRRDEYADNQWGGMYLAAQTGGFAITEANRIDSAIARVMEDQRGYYSLAFTPPPEALQLDRYGKPEFHRLKVEVTRPGLRVRTSAGFFSVADEERAAGTDLAEVLRSPFQSTGVGLDLEATYLRARKNDSFIRVTLFIDGRTLTFAGPPIHRTVTVRLLVRAFDASGGELTGGIDEARRVDLNEDGYARASKHGLIYTTLLPAMKPGPYRVRAACRDEASGRTGNASDFLLIPKFRRRGLALSGVVFQHDLGTDDHVTPALRSSEYGSGDMARYSVQVIEAPGQARTEPKSLMLRPRLFLDGKQVWEGTPEALETDTQKPGAQFFVRGALTIPAGLKAGEYHLRVDLEERGTLENRTAAWQWARLTIR